MPGQALSRYNPNINGTVTIRSSSAVRHAVDHDVIPFPGGGQFAPLMQAEHLLNTG